MRQIFQHDSYIDRPFHPSSYASEKIVKSIQVSPTIRTPYCAYAVRMCVKIFPFGKPRRGCTFKFCRQLGFILLFLFGRFQNRAQLSNAFQNKTKLKPHFKINLLPSSQFPFFFKNPKKPLSLCWEKNKCSIIIIINAVPSSSLPRFISNSTHPNTCTSLFFHFFFFFSHPFLSTQLRHPSSSPSQITIFTIS